MFSGRAKKNELTTKEIINLICDYREIANGTRLTLSGGEPTIHADFDTIVKTSSEMGLEVNVLTNGTSLTTKRIKDLAKTLSISLRSTGSNQRLIINTPLRESLCWIYKRSNTRKKSTHLIITIGFSD